MNKELFTKEEILAILKVEQARTKLGFIQYSRIEELLDSAADSDA
jgi:hypothetical protein